MFLWRNFSGVLFAYLIKEDVQNILILLARKPWGSGAIVYSIGDNPLILGRPDVISSTLWPPNSTDLNPAGYKVWGVMQEQIY